MGSALALEAARCLGAGAADRMKSFVVSPPGVPRRCQES